MTNSKEKPVSIDQDLARMVRAYEISRNTLVEELRRFSEELEALQGYHLCELHCVNLEKKLSSIKSKVQHTNSYARIIARRKEVNQDFKKALESDPQN